MRKLLFFGVGSTLLSCGNSLSHNYMADTTLMKRNAYITAQVDLTEKLKSPSSATYPVALAIKHTTMNADSTFDVVSYVDADNAYGANIRTTFMAKLKYKGGDPDSMANWDVYSDILE